MLQDLVARRTFSTFRETGDTSVEFKIFVTLPAYRDVAAGRFPEGLLRSGNGQLFG